MKRSTLVLVLGKTRVLSFSYEISLGKNESSLVFYETALVSRFCSSRPRILVLVQALLAIHTSKSKDKISIRQELLRVVVWGAVRDTANNTKMQKIMYVINTKLWGKIV